jgi:hypothetical protein
LRDKWIPEKAPPTASRIQAIEVPRQKNQPRLCRYFEWTSLLTTELLPRREKVAFCLSVCVIKLGPRGSRVANNLRRACRLLMDTIKLQSVTEPEAGQFRRQEIHNQ